MENRIYYTDVSKAETPLEEVKDIVKSLNTPEENFLKNKDNDLTEEGEKLVDYYYYLEEARQDAENNKPRMVLNKGRYKAALLISELIQQTQKEIAMAVGRLDGAVSNQEIYLNSIKHALERGVKIRVVFLEVPNENSLLYQRLQEYKNKGYEIHFYYGNRTPHIKENIENFFDNYGKMVHFMIFDDDKFRLEVEPHDYIGFGYMNHKEEAEKLLRFYNQEIVDVILQDNQQSQDL